MVNRSHAKCRQCGQSRHKNARFNLCGHCWAKVKPSVRESWKHIKERRQLRAAVDSYVGAHGQGTLFPQEEPNVVEVAQVDDLADVWEQLRSGTPTPAERDKMIARIKAAGVPPVNTPERALYMRLFITGQINEWQDKLIARLYTDSDVPVQEIMRALVVDANAIARVRRRMKLPTREDIRPWRPKGRMNDDDELVIVETEPRFRDTVTGLMRPVWVDEPEPEPEPAAPPEPEPTPEPEVTPVQPMSARQLAQQGRKYRSYSAEERQEILKLYQDPNTPLQEIADTYGMPIKTISSMANRAGVSGVRRGRLPRQYNVDQTGYYALIDGKQTWVPGPAPIQQLHLGQAPGAQLPPPNGVERQLATIPSVHERTWVLQATVTMVREFEIAAPSVDEALRLAREQHGDINVTRIEQR